MIYLLILFILIYGGVFQIVLYILKVPPTKVRKNLDKAVFIKEKTNLKLYHAVVMPLMKPVSTLVKLPTQKEIETASMLKRGGLNLSPKEYYARAIVSAGLTLPTSFLIVVVGVNQLLPVTLAFSVIVYFHFLTDLNDKLKLKKDQIEMGLPGFVRSILYKLDDVSADKGGNSMVQVDLIQIFEDYLRVANPVFHYDVAVLIMEMKSKDIEAALRNFSERIGLPEVSFLSNALIGLNRGEHQGETLLALARDMDVKARENIRKVLLKRPGQVRMASIPLVIVSIATLLYVIVSHLFLSVGGLF